MAMVLPAAAMPGSLGYGDQHDMHAAAASNTWGAQAAAGQSPPPETDGWMADSAPPAQADQARVLDLSTELTNPVAADVRVLDLASALESTAEPADAGDWDSQAAGLRASATEFVPGSAGPSPAAISPTSWAQAPEFVPQAMLHTRAAPGLSLHDDPPSPRLDISGDGSALAAAEESRRNTLNCQIVQMVQEYLHGPRARLNMDRDGYVSISRLVLDHTPLNRKSFGSTQAAVRAVKACGTRLMRLDKTCRRIRMLHPTEAVRAEAAHWLAAYPKGAEIPVRKLFESPRLHMMMSQYPDDQSRMSFVSESLEHDESVVLLTAAATHFSRRPHGMHLRKAMEMLLSDEHLAEDSRLRIKIVQSPSGDLPLSWLCSRYKELLGLSGPAGLDSIEEAARELSEALNESEFLYIDAQRQTVRRRQPLKEANDVAACQGTNGDILQGPDGQPRKRSLRNAGLRLQQLLDFYFEPFNLQHNRLLLDLIAQRAGLPLTNGPWPVEALRDFNFNLEDLMGLGRIASELARLRIPTANALALERTVGPLRHLRTDDAGRKLSLLAPPEVRSFVAAEGAAPHVSSAAMRYLSVACEQRGQAPPGLVSVLFLHAGEALLDDSSQGDQRRARVRRQMQLHHTDFICLHGFDADGAGSSTTGALAGEGYGCVSASGRRTQRKRSNSGAEQLDSQTSEKAARSTASLSGHWRNNAATSAESSETASDAPVIGSSASAPAGDASKTAVGLNNQAQDDRPINDMGQDGDEDFVYFSDDEEACAIFWDRSRWQLQSRHESRSALAVVMSPFEDLSISLKIVCIRPAVPTTDWPDLDGLLGEVPSNSPLVVCTDMSRIGGAEAASVVEEFTYLTSVMEEVVGKELESPLHLPDAELARIGAPPTIARDAASGLAEMHRPDAILFQGMVPAAALSCHTLGYLANMTPEDMMQQIPSLRLPIVAAFDWAQASQSSRRVPPGVPGKGATSGKGAALEAASAPPRGKVPPPPPPLEPGMHRSGKASAKGHHPKREMPLTFQ